MRFKFLTGDMNWHKYGGKFVSPKQNNGDWDYWLVLEAINMHEATGDDAQPKYVVELQAVSPQAAGPEHVEQALGCCGIESRDTLAIVEALSDYGISAHVWSASGNNLNRLMAQARKEAQLVNGLFGFYMDRAENMLGHTGWDFIAGDLSLDRLGIQP